MSRQAVFFALKPTHGWTKREARLARQAGRLDLGPTQATAIGTAMPTIMRFVMTLVVLAALFGAAVYALGTFVEPRTRQMTIRIPPSRLEPTPVAPKPAPAPPPTAVEDTETGTVAQ